jgi:hypothetical protein
MSEPVLTVLKFCLFALLYLFLARVLWVVSRELKGTPAFAVAAPSVAAPARSARKPWKVIVLDPEPDRGREHWIEGEATLGRASGCSISFPNDTFVSQVHARMLERDGQLWLEDLGSTNGTLLNGRPVSESVRVRKGDQLQLGQSILEVQR